MFKPCGILTKNRNYLKTFCKFAAEAILITPIVNKKDALKLLIYVTSDQSNPDFCSGFIGYLVFAVVTQSSASTTSGGVSVGRYVSWPLWIQRIVE
jgi:hypothetical protein